MGRERQKKNICGIKGLRKVGGETVYLPREEQTNKN